MNTQRKRVVVVATTQELRNSVYHRRLWMAVRNLGISRRKLMDQIAATLYDFEGEIVWPIGWAYRLPDVDELFDLDGRWISLWLEAVNDAPKRIPRPSSVEKLRVLDLYMRIQHPRLAAHFGK